MLRGVMEKEWCMRCALVAYIGGGSGAIILKIIIIIIIMIMIINFIVC